VRVSKEVKMMENIGRVMELSEKERFLREICEAARRMEEKREVLLVENGVKGRL
jgi:hypothetical protein